MSERLRGGVPGAVLVHLAVNISLSTLVGASPVGAVGVLVVDVLLAAVLLGASRRGARVDAVLT